MNTKYVIQVSDNFHSVPNHGFVVTYIGNVETTWCSHTLEEAKAHKKYCEEHYGTGTEVYKICKVEEVE